MNEDVLRFFGEHPNALPIYGELEKQLLERFPETEIVVRKTQITFRNRRVFGCASFLPVKRKSERPDPYLTVTFGLEYPKRSPRIAIVTEAQPNRWTHHVPVGSPDEIDGELISWMAEAYEFSERKK